MNQYLKKKLGMVIGEGSYKVLARKDIGANIHIFSHIKLHMHVEWLLLGVPYSVPSLVVG